MKTKTCSIIRSGNAIGFLHKIFLHHDKGINVFMHYDEDMYFFDSLGYCYRDAWPKLEKHHTTIKHNKDIHKDIGILINQLKREQKRIISFLVSCKKEIYTIYYEKD